LAWARTETKRRDMTPEELLNYLRDRICEQVLNPPEEGRHTRVDGSGGPAAEQSTPASPQQPSLSGGEPADGL
jgi:hypothetical protein